MKRILAFLLALCMLSALAACSKDTPGEQPVDSPAGVDSNEGKEQAATDAPEASDSADDKELPYVEEVPASNALDHANPIPADTGTLELTPAVFEDVNLILNLPEGVTATEETGTDNNASIVVTSDDGVWKLRLEPFRQGENLVSNVSNSMKYAGEYIKQDWEQDVAATLAGFPARVWANNILDGWIYPENEQDTPAVDIIMDYGETLVGPWYGMHVRLEAQDPFVHSNIYELLYLRHVRAVLHNIEVIATPDGVTKSAGGITATFPARWEVLEGDTSLVTAFHSAQLSGGINFSTSTPADPAEAASYLEGEQFVKTFGGKEYCCVIQTGGEEENTYYTLRMFSDFSDERCLMLFVNLRGYAPEDYKDFLDGTLFTDVVTSMEIDPNGYQAPGTASANGFNSYHGVIDSYTGDEAEIVIPSVIGAYDTYAIEMLTFADLTTITSVVIPEGVTSIGAAAFAGCVNLETVVFPDTLMEIGTGAFSDCPKLKDVVLPKSVMYVGGGAFSGSGVGTFTGPGAEYEYNCFAGSGFDTITIAAGADLSGDYMFSQSAVSEIELPADLTTLGRGAFSGCRNLEHLTLPDSLQELGSSCFTNMGYLDITLSASLEVIPEGSFSSTNLDVLIVPESVKRIESYAIYDAAYVVLQNPAIELQASAIDCDYLYIADADQFVFPEEMVLWAQCVYLDGVYSSDQIQGNLAAQYIDVQIYLPMDATIEESAAMDGYLASIGMEEIAWIGTGVDFLPKNTAGWEVQTDGVITGNAGGVAVLTLPNYVMHYEEPFWYTIEVNAVADEAFSDSAFTSIYFPGNYWGGTGARILKGNAALKDIWFNGLMIEDIGYGYYHAESFAGVPDGVTVHLPACFTEEQRTAAEQMLHECGLPETALFEYYSLR